MSEPSIIPQRLRNTGKDFFVTSKKQLTIDGEISRKNVLKALDFAYQMTFASNGKHRDHRSGGSHNRKNGEIFANTFQGKLAEFAFYEFIVSKGIKMPLPDLDTFDLGKWDSSDFDVNDRHISIKSSKSFANLLLLETKDWTDDGTYIPNNSKYDAFVFIRVIPDIEKMLRTNRLFYSDDVTYDQLESIVISEKWLYNMAGFITHQDLVQIIKNKYILPKGSLLNGTTQMDAENYYVQSGDMLKIEKIETFISRSND